MFHVLHKNPWKDPEYEQRANPKLLSVGQVLWIRYIRERDFNETVTVTALTDVAIKVSSSANKDFNDVWLPFFSINFYHNRGDHQINRLQVQR